MVRRLGLLLALGAWAAGAVVGVAVASGSGRWGRVADLSASGQTAFSPEVAMDSGGDAVVVWEQVGRSGGAAVMVSERQGTGGRWRAPVALERVAVESGLFPQVAMDSRGDTVVVWDDSGVVRSAFQPAGRRWLASVAVSPHRQQGIEPAVGIDSAGEAIAVWVAARGGALYAARRLPSSGSWGKMVRLSARGEIFSPGVRVNSRGEAVAVWKRYLSGGAVQGSRYEVQAATRGLRGRWTSAHGLGVEADGPAFPGEVVVPDIGMDARSDAIAVWQAPAPGSKGSGHTSIATAVKLAQHAWRPKTLLSAEGSTPVLATDPAGETVAVWIGRVGVTAAVRPTMTASWHDTRTISPAGAEVLQPSVSSDTHGGTIAVWVRGVKRGYVIQAAIKSARSSVWSHPITLSASGHNAGNTAVSSDASGDATAIWQLPVDQSGILIQATHTSLEPGP